MSELYSFVGGQPGQPFEIKQIFTSYYNNTNSNSLEYDLSMGWTSPVQVGEFVVISYGEPGTDSYETYRNMDLNKDGKSHNSTLWRKAYDDSYTNAGGLYYELITSMAGNTPKITIQSPATVLDADQDPAVVTDMTNLDAPVVSFQLPRSQVLQYDKETDFTLLDANEDPDFDLDSTDINEPRIKVSLPQSQVITSATIEEYLAVGEEPEVRLDTTTDGTVSNPVLKFKLPATQQFLNENVTSEVVDANVDPYIEFDDTTPQYPTLTFYLPQSQVMDDPTTVVIGSTEEPSVEDIGTVNAPKLQFSLPKSAQYYYGSLLGERTSSTYTVTDSSFSEYEVGDFYVNEATGFIYQVTSKSSDTTCVFTYLACIQSPLPTTISTAVSPYTASGDTTVPEVVRTLTNDEGTAWQLEFKLPKAPVPLLETEFVGPSEAAAADLAITSEDNYTISLTIPTGSQLFSGTAVTANTTSATVDGAQLGDVYLNSSTGVVYTLTESGWTASDSNLKGPVGDSLIIQDGQYTASGAGDIDEDVVIAQIETDLGSSYEYSPSELFKVRWTNTETSTSTDYYFFKDAQGDWGNSLITGGSDLIQKSYVASNSNKAYNVNYVNHLIGDISDADATSYFPNLAAADYTAYSKSQIDSKLATIDESISTLTTNVNETITTQIEALQTDVENNYYTKTEIDSKETTINAAITELQTAMTWGTFSDLIG